MTVVKKILISGGGTGGHIYPAIAIANELKKRYPNTKFLFVGAQDKMEMEKVPQAGYPIMGLWIAGLQRKFTFSNLMFPLKVIHSILKSFVIINRFKPDVVVGTGGFASGPLLYVASLKKIPTLIQEQNSYPGITNKILAKSTNSICVAYNKLERFFPAHKIQLTGNPVREDLLNVQTKRTEAIEYFNLDPTKKTLLVLGGSLGARAINQTIEAAIDQFKKDNIQVIWQTGKFYIATYRKYDEVEGIQTHTFIARMDLAYAAADYIVSRSGASSVSELCIVGKPVIFIPSPNVAEDHQTKNALAIVNEEGAILLPEKEKDTFAEVLHQLHTDKSLQEKLANNITKLGLPNATKDIVNHIEKIAQWT